MRDLVPAIIRFYLDGFRNMRLGRLLWTIILFKLIIFFGVIKPFFMPDYLESRFADNTAAKAAYVLERLTEHMPPAPAPDATRPAAPP